MAKVDTSDYRTLTYIYDSVNSSTGFDRFPLGFTAEGVSDQYLEDVKQVVNLGLPFSQYLYTYSSESGAHTTAGLPVFDKDGNVAAILGVEIPMTTLNEARNTYVRNTLIAAAVIAVSFFAVYTVILGRKVITPIQEITEEANRFVSDGVKSGGEISSMRHNNEIGILAQSITHMEADIERYIENLTSITAEKERIGAELDVARHIQGAMLPCIFPAYPERKEFDIFASMNPAKEVGGDFYDFFLVDDDHLVMVVADVSGKGVPAAMFMMISKTLIKSAANLGLSPKEILERVNNQLCENNDAEMFVTVWLGKLCLSTGEMVCANAGHEYPAICRKDQPFELYKDRHGFVLAGMPNMRYREYELKLSPGDVLYMYTDGVTEATDIHHELYSTDRMIDALNTCRDQAPKDITRLLRQDIDRFVGKAEQFDDITMLCIRYKGSDNEMTLEVDARADQLEKVQGFIEENLQKYGCSPKVSNQVNIAAEEIFINIASYAYPQGQGKAILKIRFNDVENTVILRFEDTGIRYNPLVKEDPDITLCAENRPIGGLGIFMTKKIMDDITYQYENGSNILTLYKKK